jgi:hypothetical protein
MDARGHNAFIVYPTNKLAPINFENGETLNTFVAVCVAGDATQRMAKFCDSGHGVNVFSEAYFASANVLAKIKRRCESHPHNIMLVTGDAN